VNPLTTLKLAFRALWRNKVRTLLTMFGIIFGIGAVIAMVASGQGAQESVREVFRKMGTNLLIIQNGSVRTGGAAGGLGSRASLTWEDYKALKDGEVPLVHWVAPVLGTRVQVAAMDTNWNTTVTGTTPTYFQIKNWELQEGTMFDEDATATTKVAVVGTTIVTQLYNGASPLGQAIRINGQPYEVIGVLASKGQNAMGQDQDDTVIIPLKPYLSKMDRGLAKYITKGSLYVSVVSEDDIPDAQAKITALLRDRHKLDSTMDDDFLIRNLAEQALAQQQSAERISTLLAIVAAISLVIGGIGVMNIMLVSVIERTREIGIRMAVGAKPTDVMTQFLVEALVLSSIGGILGLAVGAGGAAFMADLFGWQLFVPAATAGIAIAVAGGVGIVFGLYPAIRASQLDPITALRYES
jgi:putative ABC transport system permease protein